MDRNRYPGVTKRGRGWQVSFQYQNQRRRETVLLPQTSKGEREAFEYLALVNREITLGIFNYRERFPRSRKSNLTKDFQGTISAGLDEFMRLHGPSLAKSTRIDYQRRIDKHLIPAFGHISVGDLTRTHVMDWIIQTSSSLSPKSIRNTLCPLMAMYSEAIRDGLIITSPLSNLRLPKLATREPNPFSMEEQESILSELTGQPRNYFLFAFETGLRTSELIALKWHDVISNQRRVHVSRAKVRGEIKEPKTKSGNRYVDLTDRALTALECQRFYSCDSEYIFLDPVSNEAWRDDKPLRVRYWYPALTRANVVHREPYQTRHTFASTCLSRNRASPLWVAKQMGHSNCSQVYEKYARWIEN